MKDTKDYVFKFVWWKEIINFVLHVLVGGIVAHTFLPYLKLWSILVILVAIGAGREIVQQLRGKIQPVWISTVDAISFGLGGLLWYFVITYYNINVDFL